MKKMLLATAWPCLFRMCSTDVYCSKQTGGSSTKGNHHPSFLRFWNWAEEAVDAAKICGGAENIVKTGNPANIRKNGLLGFVVPEHLYSAGSAVCIAHNNCMSCPSIWAALSTLLINTSGFLPVVFA